MKMGYDRIYQASNTCVFVLVEYPALSLIPATQVSVMIQFPVVPWGLHRDGIIMVSCGSFYGVYMTTIVSAIFLYPSKNDGGHRRNCSLTRVIRVQSTFFANQGWISDMH